MIVDNGKYYLYRHIRMDKNVPFYIGIGKKRRGYEESSLMIAYPRAYRKSRRTNYWYNITEKIEYEVEILFETNDVEFLYKKEREFILLYGRVDLRNGTLVNVTDGGKFTKISKSSIDKRIETKKDRGNLSNAINLRRWMSSSEYKNPRAKKIYLYSIDGKFIKEFDSVFECSGFLGRNGGFPSWISKQCEQKKPYKNKYLFSWEYVGESIEPSTFNLSASYHKSVAKVCVNTGNVLNVYEKMIDAATEFGLKDVKKISEAVIKNRKFGGFLWRKQQQNIPLKDQQQT